eukprot:EG_transcript_7979
MPGDHWRGTELSPRGGSSVPWRDGTCWSRLLACLAALVAKPSDPTELRERKLVMLFATAALCLIGLMWGILYVRLEAWTAAWFPFTMVVLSVVAAALLFYSREMVVAGRILCLGVCLHAIGVHWSFAGQSSGVVNWALFAPQFVFFTGGRSWAGWLLFSVVAMVLAAYFCLEAVMDVRKLTPERAVVPPGWVVAFEFINILIPWFASFTVTWMHVRQMRNQRQHLECNLAQAEGLAQRIIDFDLEGIEPLGSGAGTVVALLSQVACNLKLYRPYLPLHLMQPQTSDDGSFAAAEELLRDNTSPDHTPEHGAPWGAIAGDHPLSLGEKGRTHSMRGPGTPRALRAPHVPFEIDQQMRCGTLLYFHLGEMGFSSKDEGSSELLEKIRRTASTVAQVVLDALKEHHGTLLFLQPNCGLACWNFISRCRSHALSACHAALAIRDILTTASARMPGMLPLQVSMGLWSGQLVSGSFGTEEFKTSSALGSGMARVMDLQHYALAHRRSIIVNGEAVRHLHSHKLRLLPVDVLATGRQAARVDYLLNPAPSEVVYELLEEVRVSEDEWMYQLQTV